MAKLSPVDQLFLWLEKRQQPMHVGGLLLFSYPEDAGPEYISELAQSMREYMEPVSPLNQRLVKKRGMYRWEKDEYFDLEHHFRHRALPKPGRIRELLEFVSIEHSNLLQRERPLWECNLIEGIEGNRFAFYNKVHHAMFDGIAATRMNLRGLSPDPEVRGLPPIWATPPQRKRKPGQAEPYDFMGGLGDLFSSLGKQFATIPSVTTQLVKALNKARKDPEYSSLFNAPQSILNEPITGSRRFAAQSYDIDRVKAISQKFEVTLNDVVLAICGHALRRYLKRQDALPDSSLVAMVPVSLRQDDSASGNQIAMIFAKLGTHIEKAGERLEFIKRSVEESKNRFAQLSPEGRLNYTAIMMAPAGVHLLTGKVPSWQTFNVVISNVPGPTEPLYWNGARLEGWYPVSIPVDRIALNITLLSYKGQLEFGLTACRRTLPSMQRLLDYIEEGIVELEKAAGV